jgi:uncharacterized membrane protein YkvI
MEKAVIIIGFILTGLTVGFFTFLLLRMGMHPNRFRWAGALSVVTTLAGGGFITYSSAPLHFASYGIGYFFGVVLYILYLWMRSVGITSVHLSKVSRATSNEILSEVAKEVVAIKSKRLLR